MRTDAFQGRLLPRERILWRGAPTRGILFTGIDFFFVPFTIVWCAMAFNMTFETFGTDMPFVFYLIPILFIFVGLFALVGRFALDVWLRRRTSYAVTDRRVLIDRPAPLSSFTALKLETLPEMRLVGERGGYGTLRFGASSFLSGYWGLTFGVPSLDPTPQFLKVENARKVFDLIMRAQDGKERSDR